MRMRFALGENRHGLVGARQAFQRKQSSRVDHKHVAAIVHPGKTRPPFSVCFLCPSGHTKKSVAKKRPELLKLSHSGW